MSIWIKNQILRFVSAVLLIASAFAYAYEAESLQDTSLLVAGFVFGLSCRQEREER